MNSGGCFILRYEYDISTIVYRKRKDERIQWHTFEEIQGRLETMQQREQRDTYTVTEAAQKLGIGRNQAYEAVKAGEIPFIKIGGRILIPKARLKRMLQG